MTLISLVFLAACSQPDISGTWYSENNNSELQLSLEVDEKDVDLIVDYISYSSGFLSVKSEVKSETVLTGTIEGNKINFKKAKDTPREARSLVAGLKGVTYELSKDKTKLTLTTADKEKLNFLVDNPVELG